MLRFTFDGRRVQGYEGDSIAAALFAAGVRIFSRSFKYHRPRGLLCCAGRCPNCLMNVDGTPNARTCVTPLREGMQVRSQNAWPSLERDLLSIAGLADRLLPVGFYYKTFIHPRALWPVAARVLRHAAGLGCVQRGSQPEGYHHEYRTTDVAVVGGGPAGMAASLAAARAGCRVTLVEEQEALGGMLRGDARARAGQGEYAGQSGSALAAGLTRALETAGVAVWTGATAFGLYEGNQLGVQRGDTLVELRYHRLVLATGAFERPVVFAGNDLPGVMLGTGAQRLLRLYGVRPGRRAVVATSHDGGRELAEELLDAGVEVACVADIRERGSEGEIEGGRDRGTEGQRDGERRVPAKRVDGGGGGTERGGVRVVRGGVVARAYGRKELAGVELVSPGGGRERVACDFLCLSLGWEPADSLLAHAGVGALRWDAERSVFCAGEGKEEILAAGSVTGVASLDDCLALGEAAGRAAAFPGKQGHEEVRKWGNGEMGEWLAPAVVSPFPNSPIPQFPAEGRSAQRRRFVCLCEDVTEQDIAQAVEEGFDHIETLKRYTTASMGPCQGKLCRAAVSEICARCTGQSPAEVGVSRARPPAQPVTLGALGAERSAPVRRTPMHHRHLALGARMMDLGEWKRPEVYSTVEEECRAVRERVGLIDVGTLGKLEVVGNEAAALLEKVYTNRFRDLTPGRVRYGVVCDDAGIILDDGTFARLDEERWFLTTTSGGVEAVEQWLRWWAVPAPGSRAPSGPPCVHVTNVTASLAAMNLAGPRARDALSRLTEVDLSPEAFPYLGAREGMVAGVRALLLRIGFVGELGYEIHCPAEYGAYLWDALLEAGREFGTRPFGVEAQRILRLEKQHIIVGHDTDALSNPLDAGMPWVVKFEKEGFVGRPSLLRAREGSGGPQAGTLRLVGFVIEEGDPFLPEGSQVVEDGRGGWGRVTSYRRSPTLEKGIGLAWVPEASAHEGVAIRIAAPAGIIAASVTTRPFYDPEGVRVRM